MNNFNVKWWQHASGIFNALMLSPRILQTSISIFLYVFINCFVFYIVFCEINISYSYSYSFTCQRGKQNVTAQCTLVALKN